MKVLLILATIFNFNLFASPLIIDDEIYQDIIEKAEAYSGYDVFTPDTIPNIRVLSQTAMYEEVCGEDISDCSNMAAFFNTKKYEILVRDDFDFNNDMENSFLLHELVHALQFLKFGDAIFEGCEASLKTEQEAYDVQNKYLRSRGQLFIAGSRLRYASCPK